MKFLILPFRIVVVVYFVLPKQATVLRLVRVFSLGCKTIILGNEAPGQLMEHLNEDLWVFQHWQGAMVSIPGNSYLKEFKGEAEKLIFLKSRSLNPKIKERNYANRIWL